MSCYENDQCLMAKDKILAQHYEKDFSVVKDWNCQKSLVSKSWSQDTNMKHHISAEQGKNLDTLLWSLVFDELQVLVQWCRICLWVIVRDSSSMSIWTLTFNKVGWLPKDTSSVWKSFSISKSQAPVTIFCYVAINYNILWHIFFFCTHSSTFFCLYMRKLNALHRVVQMTIKPTQTISSKLHYHKQNTAIKIK